MIQDAHSNCPSVLDFVRGLLPRAWAQAKEEFNVREHYTKYEFRIPMRDGVHLFTSVYVPKDTSVAYPFLVDRTPYSVGPMERTNTARRWGPRKPLNAPATFSFTRMCAGVTCRRASSWKCVRTSTRSAATRTWTTAPTCTTRWNGCSTTCPTTMATSASGEFPIRAFTPRPALSTRIPPSRPPHRRLP